MCRTSKIVEGQAAISNLLLELNSKDEICVSRSYDNNKRRWYWMVWRKDNCEKVTRFFADRYGAWVYKNQSMTKDRFYYPDELKRHFEKHLKVEIQYVVCEAPNAGSRRAQ